MKKLKIEEIDKNFIVKDETVKEGTRVYDVREAPFSVHGVLSTSDGERAFCRMDTEAAARVSDGVAFLNTNCAGGRVRFQTNSSYIAVKAILKNIGKMPHFALTGSAGFDLYSDKTHLTTFQPRFDITNELFGEYSCDGREMVEYTLNLPLYSGVKEIYIILDEDAVVQKAAPYQTDKPIVFYGSSITQGGCASRPGTAYTAILSRRLHLDYINLGFSGSAKGEEEMAQYIAGLDMSAFVLDYDHNAPTIEHLMQTHKRFFEIVRKAHPNLPIICITQPIPRYQDHKERAQVIEKTVLEARQSGDTNVCFLNMMEYLDKKGVLNEASVDKSHPNDLGFFFMAEAVEEMMKNFL